MSRTVANKRLATATTIVRGHGCGSTKRKQRKTLATTAQKRAIASPVRSMGGSLRTPVTCPVLEYFTDHCSFQVSQPYVQELERSKLRQACSVSPGMPSRTQMGASPADATGSQCDFRCFRRCRRRRSRLSASPSLRTCTLSRSAIRCLSYSYTRSRATAQISYNSPT
jgi:hypothetical protein